MLPPVLAHSRRKTDTQHLKLSDLWVVLGIWLVLAASVYVGSLAIGAA